MNLPDALGQIIAAGVALTLVRLLAPAMLPNPYEPDDDEGTP